MGRYKGKIYGRFSLGKRKLYVSDPLYSCRSISSLGLFQVFVSKFSGIYSTKSSVKMALSAPPCSITFSERTSSRLPSLLLAQPIPIPRYVCRFSCSNILLIFPHSSTSTIKILVSPKITNLLIQKFYVGILQQFQDSRLEYSHFRPRIIL